jgi:hypothetical protein
MIDEHEDAMRHCQRHSLWSTAAGEAVILRRSIRILAVRRRMGTLNQ